MVKLARLFCAALLATGWCGCRPTGTSGSDLEKKTERTQSVRDVLLERPSPDVFRLQITNLTEQSILFSPRFDYVILTHEASDGAKTVVSLNPAAVDMMALSPGETVWLVPRASYSFQISVDRPEVLKVPGVVYADVHPISSRGTSKEFLTLSVETKRRLLSHVLRSNSISVP